MRLDALHMRFDARNLGLQGGNTLLELVDRHWIEVLFAQRYHRVVWFAWKEVVQVHGQNR